MRAFKSLPRNEREKYYRLMEKLRSNGKTYSEIQDFLRGKNIYAGYATISKNLRKVKISEEGLCKHKKTISDSMRKNPFIKDIKTQGRLTEEKVRLIAHCLFDGYVQGKGDWEINYCNISKPLVDQFCNDFYAVYEIRPTVLQIRKNEPFGKFPLHRARFYSVKASEDLLKYTPAYSTESEMATIPAEILDSNAKLKKVFLRAFWDDEGSVTIDKNNVRLLQATCPNNRVRKQLIEMHREFDIDSEEADNRIIRITHRRNIRKFNEKIGFTAGGIISAKSKKWQNTEKTQLLEIVLNSYKGREYK